MTLGSHQTAIGKSQDHITPRWIITRLGPFTTDPCAADPRPWDCAEHNITEAQDGLRRLWLGYTWLNPPFDQRVVGRWIERRRRVVACPLRSEMVRAVLAARVWDPVLGHAPQVLPSRRERTAAQFRRPARARRLRRVRPRAAGRERHSRPAGDGVEADRRAADARRRVSTQATPGLRARSQSVLMQMQTVITDACSL
jgi:hypothetical protein